MDESPQRERPKNNMRQPVILCAFANYLTREVNKQVDPFLRQMRSFRNVPVKSQLSSYSDCIEGLSLKLQNKHRIQESSAASASVAFAFEGISVKTDFSKDRMHIGKCNRQRREIIVSTAIQFTNEKKT